MYISEGSFQNMLNYNKQKLQGVAPWGKDQWIGNQIWLPTWWQITDFWMSHSKMQALRWLTVAAKWKKDNVRSNDRSRSIEGHHCRHWVRYLMGAVLRLLNLEDTGGKAEDFGRRVPGFKSPPCHSLAVWLGASCSPSLYSVSSSAKWGT